MQTGKPRKSCLLSSYSQLDKDVSRLAASVIKYDQRCRSERYRRWFGRTMSLACLQSIQQVSPASPASPDVFSITDTVNSSPVNLSHTRLITQSTCHKRAQNKTTSTSRNCLHAVRRHPETVLNTDGIITAICVTLMYTADYRSRR